MCFPTCSALGSFFLVFSFILEIFLIIGQVSNRWFLTRIYFAEAYNRNQNISYSFGLWNYCTGDASRNIQNCASTKPAYNWAETPNIVDLVPDLANSKIVDGIFYALFILIFISMGLNFIFWVMSIPIVCTRHKRGWGYSMTTLCLINFLITLVCVVLSLILILAGVRHITGASQDWDAHAGNSLWIIIGVCVSNFIALFCYSGGTCCSRHSSSSRDDDVYENEDAEKRGCFACCGRRRKNKTQVDPVDKNYTDNYNSMLPDSAQPMHSQYNNQAVHSPYNLPVHSPYNQPTTTMLQQPYVVSNGADSTAATAGAHTMSPVTENPNVPAHGYQTPVLEQSHVQNH